MQRDSTHPYHHPCPHHHRRHRYRQELYRLREVGDPFEAFSCIQQLVHDQGTAHSKVYGCFYY